MKTSSRRSTAAKPSRKPAAPAPKKKAAPVVRTANHQRAIRDYEEALKHFSRKEYSRAVTAFGAVLREHPTEREVCDRTRMYIAVCKARTAASPPKPRTPDDLYYQGVLAANDGRLDEAAMLFDRVTRQDPACDKAWYSLAAVCSLKSDRAGAIGDLSKAIGLNRSNRTYALNDPDFDPLREDAEFMALLGKAPEGGA